jgi:LDH2 family malate/lactate/ureidoglycolate dehydrogenase
MTPMPENRIPLDEARRLCEVVFGETMGAPGEVIVAATDVLVDADLRGIPSHGIAVLPYYLDKWQQGQIVPDALPELVSETATTAVFAGNRAVGHYTSRLAMETAIEKAGVSGMGSAVVRNSTHNGAISAYTIQAARCGLLGISATACAPHVAPPGGRRGLHGTNPISYALPRPQADPLVFDLSTGHSSAKLKDKADDLGHLPEGTALDAKGNPTTNPDDLKDGWILPVAGHVGFGLALLVDGLTAALADSPIGREIPLVHETDGPYHGSFFCLAIDPEAFGGAEAFGRRIESLVEQIQEHPARDPADPVRWPGQRGWAAARENQRLGIPFDADRRDRLHEELRRFGVRL